MLLFTYVVVIEERVDNTQHNKGRERVKRRGRQTNGTKILCANSIALSTQKDRYNEVSTCLGSLTCQLLRK